MFPSNDTSSTPFQKKLNSSNAPVIDKKKIGPFNDWCRQAQMMGDTISGIYCTGLGNSKSKNDFKIASLA